MTSRQQFFTGEPTDEWSVKQEEASADSLRRERILRVGTVKMMQNGQRAVCVSYDGPQDIGIEFEDGTRMRGQWRLFSRGYIEKA